MVVAGCADNARERRVTVCPSLPGSASCPSRSQVGDWTAEQRKMLAAVQPPSSSSSVPPATKVESAAAKVESAADGKAKSSFSASPEVRQEAP